MTYVEMLKKNLSARKHEQHALMLRTFESVKSFEGYLIAVGMFKQIKSDIDVILSQLKKRDPDGDPVEEEPIENEDIDDGEEEEESVSERSRRNFSKRRPNDWGGS